MQIIWSIRSLWPSIALVSCLRYLLFILWVDWYPQGNLFLFTFSWKQFSKLSVLFIWENIFPSFWKIIFWIQNSKLKFCLFALNFKLNILTFEYLFSLIFHSILFLCADGEKKIDYNLNCLHYRQGSSTHISSLRFSLMVFTVWKW